jgi:hypothetical protein
MSLAFCVLMLVLALGTVRTDRPSMLTRAAAPGLGDTTAPTVAASSPAVGDTVSEAEPVNTPGDPAGWLA